MICATVSSQSCFFWLHRVSASLAKNSLVAQMVKHLPSMWETWVQSLGWEDPLEEEMATHSSIPVWKIPWTKESDRLQSVGSQRVRHHWVTSLHFNIINLILLLTIWWCPCVESSLVLLEEGVCYDQCSLFKTLLAFALLNSPGW